MVGSRRFWELVSQGRAIGSSPRAATVAYQRVPVRPEDDPAVAVEAWQDGSLQRGSCKDMIVAAARTAAQFGLRAEASKVVKTWCDSIQKQKLPRSAEVRILKRLAASKACNLTVSPGNISATQSANLVNLLDSIAEIHRLEENDQDLA